jgi:hypothetical protein
MDEAGVTGNLEPEIPVLEQIQVFVETATQIDDLAPEKYRVQWHQVARKQAQFVERQIERGTLGLAILIGRLYTGIGGQQFGRIGQRAASFSR